MAQLDLIASQPQYLAHLEPVWAELAPEARSGQGGGQAALVSSARDLAAAHRAGYRRIAYLEHGVGQRYGTAHGYPGGQGRGAVSLFLSPNAQAAAADRAAYPAATVVEVGDPRLDTLPVATPGPLAVAVSFHWQCSIAPEAGSALRHYRQALAGLAGRWPLIGHAHPKAAAQLEPLWARLGVEYVAAWDDVLRRASVYVCDNSSTLFEFASTGRPVVVLNAPWYRRHVEHGLRFWQAATVGVQVDQPDQLDDALDLALADPPSQQLARAAALRLAYTEPHGAAARAARALEAWLDGRDH